MTIATKHVTVSRTVLRDAIEQGIRSVRRELTLKVGLPVELPAEAATALRAVGETATVIAVGTYRTASGVSCPVSLAFPGRWAGLRWDTAFARVYDRAMREAGCVATGHVVYIAEDGDRPT